MTAGWSIEHIAGQHDVGPGGTSVVHVSERNRHRQVVYDAQVTAGVDRNFTLVTVKARASLRSRSQVVVQRIVDYMSIIGIPQMNASSAVGYAQVIGDQELAGICRNFLYVLVVVQNDAVAVGTPADEVAAVPNQVTDDIV